MDQLELDFQTKARDRALDLLEERRMRLVDVGFTVAVELASVYGQVTSTEVFQVMRERGYGQQIDACDKRWMGAVFRAKRGWIRVGWVNNGSHRRPVAIWRLREAATG